MSIVDMREDLAGAASTVVGVKGYRKRPPAPTAGDAWPMLRSLPRDEDSGQFFALWRLIVMLPQDEEAALKFIDEHVDALADALQPVAHVEDAGQPARLQTSAGELMVLEIQLRGEM